MNTYRDMLSDIGYIEPEGHDFTISTQAVDDEIAHVASPQVVVPVSNARWGSLYDALYGTDAIAEDDGSERGETFNETRAQRVITWTHNLLDRSAPLATGSHSEVTEYRLDQAGGQYVVAAMLTNGNTTGLMSPDKFAGFVADSELKTLLLVNHGLHIELHIDRQHQIGNLRKVGIKDMVI